MSVGGPNTPPQGGMSDPFAAVGMAADDAAADPAVTAPPTSVDSGAPKKSWSETYQHELRLNMEAHRAMRWWAFGAVGIIVVVFFAIVAAAFCRVFFGNQLAAVLGAAGDGWEWHVLVFLGLGLALLASIPLSLSLAMVKMISDKEDASVSELKTPSTELGKVLRDMIKGFVAREPQ